MSSKNKKQNDDDNTSLKNTAKNNDNRSNDVNVSSKKIVKNNVKQPNSNMVNNKATKQKSTSSNKKDKKSPDTPLSKSSNNKQVNQNKEIKNKNESKKKPYTKQKTSLKSKISSKKKPVPKQVKKGIAKKAIAKKAIAKKAIVKKVTSNKNNKKTDDCEKQTTRYFKAVYNENEKGRFSGDKPKQAANKALTSITKEFKIPINKMFEFSVKECTRGSRKKTYTYVGKRIELDDEISVKIDGKTIKYKYSNVLKKKVFEE
jgi:hypothetical protein